MIRVWYTNTLPIVWVGALVSTVIFIVMMARYQQSGTRLRKAITWFAGTNSLLLIVVFGLLESRISLVLVPAGLEVGLGVCVGFICAHLLTIRKYTLAAAVFVIALLLVVNGLLLTIRNPVTPLLPQQVQWATNN